jgi:hypothetical protein
VHDDLKTLVALSPGDGRVNGTERYVIDADGQTVLA